MDEELAKAYEELEEDIRSAIRRIGATRSDEYSAQYAAALSRSPLRLRRYLGAGLRSGDKEYVKFLVTTPQNLKEDGLYAKGTCTRPDIREELRQGRACQVYATYTGEKDVYAAATEICAQQLVPGCRAALFGCHRQAMR